MSWETLIVGVNTWTRGTERAVHKPLLVLMILGHAQRGEPANVFRFRSIDEPLRESLRAFGPSRKSYRSEYPFWYLKDDGFWVVHNEARLAALKRGREPSRRLLPDEDAAAEVPRGLLEELSADPARVAGLVQKVLEMHWEDPKTRARMAAEVLRLQVEEKPTA